MTEQAILSILLEKYPELIDPGYPFPVPSCGHNEIKAIILGADPTHIVDGNPLPLQMVFGLDKEKSPYWNSMRKNLDQIGLTLDDIYVQNVCRNYFKKETTNNEQWVEIARNYWIPYLKKELDLLFNGDIPILMTTQFIMHAAINNIKRKIKASEMYNNRISIPWQDNLFSRELFAFYRHPSYSLKAHPKYRQFLLRIINPYTSFEKTR